MAAAPADVRAIAPEFAGLADPTIQSFLDDALLEINATVWSTKADRGQKLLAAHMLSVAYPDLAQPAAPSKLDRVGQVEAEYAIENPGANAGELAASRHGLEFARLRRGLACGAMTL